MKCVDETFKPFDVNEFYDELDEFKRMQRKTLCICADLRELALLVWNDEKQGKRISAKKKVIVHDVIDRIACNTDLILDDEILALAYLVNWAVKDLRFFPNEWMPIVDFLSDCEVGYEPDSDEVYF